MIKDSQLFSHVHYAIRGRVTDKADSMLAQGKKIIKLNIGNMPAFGFSVPKEIEETICQSLSSNAGYCHSTGLLLAKEAIIEEQKKRNKIDLSPDDVLLGNGVSELILSTTQALLEHGDEILIPMPDYPLWTACTHLANGTVKHYRCLEDNNWYPDLDDIEKKVTSKTKAIVVINPNNPTGSVYSKDILLGIIEIARRHKLLILSDEIYNKITYDGHKAIAMASLADDVPILTYCGLSKNYCAPGYRSGWLTLTGSTHLLPHFRNNLNKLSSMRLGPNTFGQLAVAPALQHSNYYIKQLTQAGGRLFEQRNLIDTIINDIPGLSAVKANGSFYMFANIDPKIYPIENDENFAFKLLEEQNILITHASGFNMDTPNYFRIVFLPTVSELTIFGERLKVFFENFEAIV